MSVDLDIPPTNMIYVLLFARLYLLLYETQKEKNTTKKSYAYVWACPIKVGEGIERVQYFKSKGNVATMLKQSLQEIKPTWHIKTTYNMRRRQMVSTSTVNNTFKKNMLKQSWICLTEAFIE